MRLAPFVWSAGGDIVDDPGDPRRIKVAVSRGRASSATFVFSRSLRSRVWTPLRGGRTRTEVSVLVMATATDPAGNVATRKLTVKLRR